MLGASGFEIPDGIMARTGGLGSHLLAIGVVPSLGGGSLIVSNIIWILVAAMIALILPNVAQIFHRYDPVLYENDKAFSEIRKSRLFE